LSPVGASATTGEISSEGGDLGTGLGAGVGVGAADVGGGEIGKDCGFTCPNGVVFKVAFGPVGLAAKIFVGLFFILKSARLIVILGVSSGGSRVGGEEVGLSGSAGIPTGDAGGATGTATGGFGGLVGTAGGGAGGATGTATGGFGGLVGTAGGGAGGATGPASGGFGGSVGDAGGGAGGVTGSVASSSATSGVLTISTWVVYIFLTISLIFSAFS
jgi:hypothetical protein